ncbi:MAG: PASTA domain-containing protein [Chitinophagaceae bacterium]
MFNFITKRPLWINVLFALFLLFLLVFVFLASLSFLTRHNKKLKIPSVAGKTLNEATRMLSQQGFEVEIQDSVYVDTLAPLIVTRQFPEAESEVKINRTVYLTVNRAVAPMISMPRLMGSFRNAIAILKQFGLKLGDTTYRPDFAKNSILSQLYNGKEIRPGTKVPMGSTISLVLGSGVSNTNLIVPDLFGKTFEAALDQMQAMGVGLLKVVDPGVSDTMNAYIYRQNPERLSDDGKVNRIRPGQLIDVWLSAEPKHKADTTSDSPITPQ